MQKIKTKTLAALACLLVLSGCFPSENSSASNSVLRVTMFRTPVNKLSPLGDEAFMLTRLNLAEPLTRLDGQGNAQPLLAESWEQKDPKTWAFKIRQQVKFHDGTELTAETVAKSLEYANQAKPKPRGLRGANFTFAYEGNTLTITTDKEVPLLPQLLSSPNLVVLSPKAYEGSAINAINAGTGPFKLTSLNGTSSAVAERNDKYWNGKAKLSKIEVAFASNGGTRVNALRSNSTDVAENIPFSQISQISGDQLRKVVLPRTAIMYLNNSKGPFTDPAVRAAAWQAMNRERINEFAYNGQAAVAEHLLGPALAWAEPLRKSAAYQELMKQRVEPKVAPGTKIMLGTITDRAELPEVLVQVKQQLEQAGFVVETQVKENNHIEKSALAGEFDAYIITRGMVIDSGDPVSTLLADFGTGGSYNISQLSDPKLDEVITRAGAAAAGQARHEAIMEAEAMLLSQYRTVPLLYQNSLIGVQNTVKGLIEDPYERYLIGIETFR